jgi:hypothetical protein
MDIWVAEELASCSGVNLASPWFWVWAFLRTWGCGEPSLCSGRRFWVVPKWGNGSFPIRLARCGDSLRVRISPVGSRCAHARKAAQPRVRGGEHFGVCDGELEGEFPKSFPKRNWRGTFVTWRSGNWVERRTGKAEASCCGVNLAVRLVGFLVFVFLGCWGVGNWGLRLGGAILGWRSGFRLRALAALTAVKRLKMTVWVHRECGFDR